MTANLNPNAPVLFREVYTRGVHAEKSVIDAKQAWSFFWESLRCLAEAFLSDRSLHGRFLEPEEIPKQVALADSPESQMRFPTSLV